MTTMAKRARIRALCGEARGKAGEAKRETPRPGTHQSSEDAWCRYWLERAEDCLRKAAEAWDEKEIGHG